MTAHAPALVATPEWLVAEMPPGYETRLVEVRRLTSELREMESLARVLWETGTPLEDAVAAVFTALKHEVDVTPGAAGAIGVKLEGSRRLLIHVSRAGGQSRRPARSWRRRFSWFSSPARTTGWCSWPTTTSGFGPPIAPTRCWRTRSPSSSASASM
jgi:hypothetical protein